MSVSCSPLRRSLHWSCIAFVICADLVVVGFRQRGHEISAVIVMMRAVGAV